MSALKWVAVTVAIICMTIMATVIIWPDSSVGRKIAEYIPGVEVRYKAHVTYKISSPMWSWDTMSASIQEVTIRERTFMFGIGGFVFWPETFRGKIVLTAINEDGIVADELERNVEVTEGWFEGQAHKTQADDIWLGVTGSGTYTIVLELFDTSNVRIDRDSTTRTI